VGVSEPYNRFSVPAQLHDAGHLLAGRAHPAGRHGRRAFLPDPDERGLDRARLAVFRRRILAAQVRYALAALVCLASTVASVIALALVQLYFIVSPRRPRAGTRPDADGDDG
jgi:hypothetical protein